GTLSPGAPADVIAVRGDPFKDFKLLDRGSELKKREPQIVLTDSSPARTALYLLLGLGEGTHRDPRGPRHGFEPQQFVEPGPVQQAFLEDDCRDRTILGERPVGNTRAGLVAEHRPERGHKADTILDEAQAALAIGLDPIDAALGQRVYRRGQHAQ